MRSLLPSEPTVEILEETNSDNWQSAERQWIEQMRKQGANLTNFADGGQTSPVEGKRHTEESKEKMRIAALRNGAKPPSRKGQIASIELKERLRISALRRGVVPPPMGGWNKGKKMSEEFCEKNRLGHIGIAWSTARWAAQEKRNNFKEEEE